MFSTILTDDEKSTLYYISRYVTKKDDITVVDDLQRVNDIPESEFLNLVSRGKLHQPREDLFDLSLYLSCYYKRVDKACIKRLLKGFTEISNISGFDFEGKHSKILQRFVNCFSNGLKRTHETTMLQFWGQTAAKRFDYRL